MVLSLLPRGSSSSPLRRGESVLPPPAVASSASAACVSLQLGVLCLRDEEGWVLSLLPRGSSLSPLRRGVPVPLPPAMTSSAGQVWMSLHLGVFCVLVYSAVTAGDTEQIVPAAPWRIRAIAGSCDLVCRRSMHQLVQALGVSKKDAPQR